MIIDYTFFISRYPLTTVTVERFSGLCARAQREIENAVKGTLDADNSDVKECCAELIEYMGAKDATSSAKTAGVSSESVGDYSVSYATESEQRAETRRSVNDIIRFWLGKSGLNYRGVCRHVL